MFGNGNKGDPAQGKNTPRITRRARRRRRPLRLRREMGRFEIEEEERLEEEKGFENGFCIGRWWRNCCCAIVVRFCSRRRGNKMREMGFESRTGFNSRICENKNTQKNSEFWRNSSEDSVDLMIWCGGRSQTKVSEEQWRFRRVYFIIIFFNLFWICRCLMGLQNWNKAQRVCQY